ncbi:MAG: hypothetical protein PHO75_02630 [Candidatus Shapirobacteria bacterium]|nr:hypothetical protein [Candidatus Shapirobacteria bacterium]
MGSVLSLSPLFFLPKEDLKAFFERTFPGLERYETSYDRFPGSFYICFRWKKKTIEIGLGRNKVYIFNKKIEDFIQLLIRKQLQIDQLKN